MSERERADALSRDSADDGLSGDASVNRPDRARYDVLAEAGLETERIPSFLRNLTAVVAAVVDLDGRCLDANRGFAYLLESEGSPLPSASIAHWFQQPGFGALLAATADGAAYAGNLSFGDGARFARTVRGEVWRRGGRLLLLAEHDIADLERLSATVTQLNEQLAEAQRELVRANRRLRRDKEEIRRLMLADPLTGVANRRALEERFREVYDARDRSIRVGVVVADIDRFKSVNDSYGHAVGDKALVTFAEVMLANTRNGDLVARLGGEEFCVLLTNGDLDDAVAVAERIRTAFERTEIEGVDGRLSASFGVAYRRDGEDGEDLLRAADVALYRAKAEGRNRVIIADTHQT